MIRNFSQTDIDMLLDVWLSASIKAHDFVASEFWDSQLKSMRNTYIPASEVYVYEKGQTVIGFYALVGDTLAAIFVAPDLQGAGVGKCLIAHAKSIRHTLSLSVYKANLASVAFYQSQGFEITGEGLDEATGQDEYTMRWTPNH
ncbi:N-acetyltransferase [Comamonas avium]|uniref:N-acetyltransferase n=1 Tax=Comamonas avium TaxID=2762231 RepID=A0ABR8S6R0_9BURK|nr:N-acetyltransferase [Comamonas avium]MBD7959130.1 N-acetyltransferase [Comamonas avium]